MQAFEALSSKCPHLWHGGDYNPDQWLNRPDILDRDVALMKRARVNVVSLGIFAWSALEPEEGHYTFDWLDAVMDRLYENGIYTVLATPSGAKPAWMAYAYPESRRVLLDGQREPYRGRHNHCFTSPIYRAKVEAINTRLAQRYADHPGLVLWHVSNEYSGACHCPLCLSAFQDWLKARYGTLDVLNQKWWTSFWSHTYTAWDQIVPPDDAIHGLQLNWLRWVTHQTINFMQHEMAPLRRYAPSIPVTTNLMGLFRTMDYHRFAEVCDVMSWDAYPFYHARAEDLQVAVETSFTHELFRSFKQGKPFLLMESAPSATNWMPSAKLKRPGVHALTSFQAVAHGSDSVQYFQWRAGLGGSEKFHGAVVTHDGTANTRVFNDVRDLGEKLAELDELVGSTVTPEVAFIYDWENRWAIDGACGPRREQRNYVETCLDHYTPFWRRGIPVDVVSMDADVSRYKLVVAPMLYMVRPGVGERLTQFVEQGGILVMTYWSGIVDEDDRCFEGGRPGPLRRVLGIWSEELDVLYDDERVSVEARALGDASYTAKIFCDLIHTEGAEALGTYTGEFYAGRPAVTAHAFGAGKAYYQAFRGDEVFLDAFYRHVLKELNGSAWLPIDERFPPGVTVQQRSNGTETYCFLMNFDTEAHKISLPGVTLRNAFGGEALPKVIRLAPHQVIVAKRCS